MNPWKLTGFGAGAGLLGGIILSAPIIGVAIGATAGYGLWTYLNKISKGIT